MLQDTLTLWEDSGAHVTCVGGVSGTVMQGRMVSKIFSRRTFFCYRYVLSLLCHRTSFLSSAHDGLAARSTRYAIEGSDRNVVLCEFPQAGELHFGRRPAVHG